MPAYMVIPAVAVITDKIYTKFNLTGNVERMWVRKCECVSLYI